MVPSSITLIFPHQLYNRHPAIRAGRPIWLIEEYLFFTQYRFHQQKIALHRASMKSFEATLRKAGHTVTYLEAADPRSDIRILIPWLAEQQVLAIHCTDPTDFLLRKRIETGCKKQGIQFHPYDSPNFLNSLQEGNDYFGSKRNYFQTAFYIDQRKRRKVLLDAGGQPLGGKWTFDADNREKLPAKAILPVISPAAETAFTREAKQYLKKHFPGNYGDASKTWYPTDHAAALKWLDEFLVHRFAAFGIYEDAMAAQHHFLHHSVLSPLLNTGLLSPATVLQRALEAAKEYAVPLNSTEGFIRQLIGWREYVRLVYEREGVFQRTHNFWKFSRKIPASFWRGDTGILPVDNVVAKNHSTGYNHHIERLMIMGNFFLLCEFDPNEVYRWFMELYIDAYDWVMVPNVYGMTQFADGGLMTTKPYISGSNYILKMSDYAAEGKRTGNTAWTATWDALFWRFLHVHRDFFTSNPRLGMLVKTFDKMPASKRSLLMNTAETYLASL